MTGAVSCLAGIEGIGVIIHGASGCYFYPATILRRQLYCTFLVEEDVIFGTGVRLRGLIDGIRDAHEAIAVVHTCTPAIIGEEIEQTDGDPAIITIDAPGFIGSYEVGFLSAYRALPLVRDADSPGVTVDGLSPLDPFYTGNRLEALRLLGLAGISDHVFLSACPWDLLSAIPESVITSNPDLHIETECTSGTFLGIEETVRALSSLQAKSGDISLDPIIAEAGKAKDEITRVCDKYLQRHDPPSVAIFGGSAYACFAADLLEGVLDSSITCIGSRNPAAPSSCRVVEASTPDQVQELIESDPPDIILGSSFEQSLAPSSAFIPFTFPVRGMVRLRARPLIGIQGTLGLVEDVLNASLDRISGKQHTDQTANTYSGP